MRKPFQGSINIIRFNWHFYVFVLLFCLVLISLIITPLGVISLISKLILSLTILSTISSLLVSYFIYDYSDLYTFKWLNKLEIKDQDVLVNIHSGFDESSAIIQDRFPKNKLQVLDFYDPKKHTEVSLKRARKAYPVYPKTKSVRTKDLSLASNSVAFVFLIFAAHEIRNDADRVLFFKEVKRISKPKTKIIILEHHRDLANFLAYNIGFLHFHSSSTWLNTFKESNLEIEKIEKINPFITLYYLNNGNPT